MGDLRLDEDDDGYIINGVYGVVLILHLLADAADRLASCVHVYGCQTRVFVCVRLCYFLVWFQCEPFTRYVCVCVCVCRVKTANRAAHKSVPSLPYVSRSRREMFRLMWRDMILTRASGHHFCFLFIFFFLLYFGNIMFGMRLDLTGPT